MVDASYLTDASGFTGWADRLLIPETEAQVIEILAEAVEIGSCIAMSARPSRSRNCATPRPAPAGSTYPTQPKSPLPMATDGTLRARGGLHTLLARDRDSACTRRRARVEWRTELNLGIDRRRKDSDLDAPGPDCTA